MTSLEPNDAEYRAATLRLSQGKLIGLPTETVYGLAGDATNPDALRRIFELKRRPTNHPLIVHLADVSWLSIYAKDPPEIAFRLGARFWPGPLTLVLERSDAVPKEATGGLDSVALRVPAHPVAARLLALYGRPLAAPSANLFGQVSPTTAAHVRADFGERLPVVLDGGPCAVGVESTILDIRGQPRVLRPGGISRAELSEFLGAPVTTLGAPSSELRAPGMLESHYAPRAPLEVVEPGELFGKVQRSADVNARIGLLVPGFEPGDEKPLPIAWDESRSEATADSSLRQYRGRLERPGRPSLELFLLAPGHTAGEVEKNLYDALRRFDGADCDRIFAAVPRGGLLGEAVEDRLRKAAAPRPTSDSGAAPQEALARSPKG